jgi:hypothetical protein
MSACDRGTVDCDAGDPADNPYVGWMSPGDLEPGDALGYVDADGQFAPGAAIVAVARVDDTDMWNVTTHAGSLVLRAEADVFVFAQAASR